MQVAGNAPQRGIGGVGQRCAAAGIDVGPHRRHELDDEGAEDADQGNRNGQLDQRDASGGGTRLHGKVVGA